MTIIEWSKSLLRPGRGGTIALIASFWAWCALLSFPLIGTTYDERSFHFGPDSAALVWQVSGLALFVAAATLADPARWLSVVGRLGLPQIAILAIFVLSLVLQLHDEESSILTGIFYTCIFLVAAVSLSVLWTMAPADLEMCMLGAAVILCSFGITALAISGIPEARDVGGLHKNAFATPLFAAFILSQFRPGLLGFAVRVLCAAMVALVSSRFALVGSALAMVLYEFTLEPLSRRNLLVLILALVAGIVFWPQIADIMALDDPTRGFGSGATGREEIWSDAFAAITDDPFGIGFKRTIGNEAGHNGYLKTLVEFGVIGGGLIIFFFACSVFAAAFDAAILSGATGQQRRFACARFGGMVALSFAAFFQPQLFNLGDAFGMSLLFFLFRPSLFKTRAGAAADRAAGRSLQVKEEF